MAAISWEKRVKLYWQVAVPYQHVKLKFQASKTSLRQVSGICIYAGLAICLLDAWIQFDPYDSAILDKFVSTRGCNMAHSMMQFHDQHWLNSVSQVKHVYNFVQVSLSTTHA